MVELVFTASSSERSIEYPGFVCYVCLKTMSEFNLLRCKDCKLIFYCNQEHQKSDWRNHKALCKAVQKLSEEFKLLNFFGGFFTLCKFFFHEADVFATSCEQLMKRKLSIRERQLFANPFACKVCRIYKSDDMLTCTGCSAATYCSRQHKLIDSRRHALVCKDLKKCLDYEKLCVKGFVLVANISDNFELPADMRSFISNFNIVKTKPSGKKKFVAYRLSELFSIPLTIIYVIEKGLPDTKMKNELTIHVVGCGMFENSAVDTWECLFHYFKSLKSLNIVFVGPDSSDYLQPPGLACNVCRSTCQINVKMENAKYREYLQKEPSEKPDVIIAFHPGFYDHICLLNDQSWVRSIPSFCSFSNAVVAFTSYNETEAENNLKIFKKYCGTSKIEFLVESELNPFRYLLPIPKLCEIKEVAYNNCYITILKKK